jgi:hypothetical protein
VPAEPGPLALAIEGEVGSLDEIATLQLVVRNRAPRTLQRPVVEIELPTGAELTADDERRLGVQVTRGGGVLTLRLPPMRPGNVRRIPLPLRWSVGGSLVGLGVAARADDRDTAVAVLPPRSLAFEERNAR